jgi:hypothetical protein
MENRATPILDAWPREPRSPSLTILSMQKTSPIRRYVVLRRGHDGSASRWSMERIAPAAGGAASAPSAEQPAKRARDRS